MSRLVPLAGFLALLAALLVLLATPAGAAVTYDELLVQLPATFAGGSDPYASQYVGVWPLMRHPVQRAWEGPFVLLDNLRNGRVRTSDGVDRGLWTSALVDLTKVRRATFHLSVFYQSLGPVDYPIAHGQMVVDFDEGGVVTPEGPVSGLVLSFEAYRGEGEAYDALAGFKKTYRSIMTLSAPREALRYSAAVDPRLELHELALDPPALRAFVENVLREGFDQAAQQATWYHTTRASCITQQFRHLNLVLPEAQRIREWHSLLGMQLFRTLGTTIPRRVGRTLRRAGLVRWEAEFLNPDESLPWVEGRYGADAFLGDPELPASGSPAP